VDVKLLHVKVVNCYIEINNLNIYKFKKYSFVLNVNNIIIFIIIIIII